MQKTVIKTTEIDQRTDRQTEAHRSQQSISYWHSEIEFSKWSNTAIFMQVLVLLVCICTVGRPVSYMSNDCFAVDYIEYMSMCQWLSDV